MIVRVRGVEVVCETLDELEQIIQRFGGEIATPTVQPMARTHSPHDHDARLLRAFVRSPSGLPSTTVQGMLGVKGKAIPYALREWAMKVRLPPDSYVKTTISGKRGWKLSAAGFNAARTLLDES